MDGPGDAGGLGRSVSIHRSLAIEVRFELCHFPEYRKH